MAFGADLGGRCQDTLTLTRNAQPALMATSMAVMAALKSEGVGIGAAAFVAGHSLGEYSALAAAGALSVSDAARLLRARGEAMQRAVAPGAGAMAAILGLGMDEVRAVAAEAAGDEVVEAANDNDPAQVVISGNAAGVARAVEIAKARGAKRAVMLPVSAPFHCALMAPAAEEMAAALAGVAIRAPAVPVVANVRAAAVTDPDEIRALLVDADHPVGPLARERGLDGGAGRHGLLGDRRGQGAVGHDPPHREGGRDARGPVARGRGGGGGQPGGPETGRKRHVRSHGKDRARHRRIGRHRCRHRDGRCTARGRHGRAVGDAGRAARALAGNSATGSMSCPATCPTPRRWTRCRSRRPRRWARSTSSSTTPGITRDNLFMRMSEEEWDDVIEVNLTATMRLCKGVVRGMMKARWGRIVNISSVVGATGNPGQANYAASKGGMVGMSKAIAYEVASRGITVNCVAPGLHRDGDDRQADRRAEGRDPPQVPAGRMGAPGRDRGRGALSREPRSGLCHGRDAACERRHGDALRPRGKAFAFGITI
jgi:NAD(P)-dependent dehydrogenase (short-subunit alcohol dehydrogenase family)